MSSSQNSSKYPFKINIKGTNETKKEVEITENVKTVADLKEIIGKETNIPASDQRLIFVGKLLKDTDEISKYALTDGCTMHLVKTGASKPKTINEPVQPPAGIPTAQPVNQNQAPFPGMGMFNPNAQMNPNAAIELMRNPEISAGISQMLQANPNLLQSLIQSNPSFQSLPPEMQHLMTNPDFVRTMMNPDLMSSLMAMSGQASTQDGAAAGQAGNTSGFQMPAEFNPWGMAGNASYAQVAPTQSAEPPATRYAAQIEQLKQMGFYDENLNIQALTIANGNVNVAIEWLLNRPF